MNAEGILKRINQDAREAAAAILQDAQRKADELRRASDERIDKSRTDALETARQEALALDDRMQRMAKLDARKDLLAAKRVALDEAFALAQKKLEMMPDTQARQFGLTMLLEAATGSETLVADESSAWCDQAFVDAANAALKKDGRPGNISLSQSKRKLGGGFILERGGMEINCSYPAALTARRMDIEAEVASLLFDT